MAAKYSQEEKKVSKNTWREINKHNKAACTSMRQTKWHSIQRHTNNKHPDDYWLETGERGRLTGKTTEVSAEGETRDDTGETKTQAAQKDSQNQN